MNRSGKNILVVNPGGTSTKVALFQGEEAVFSTDVRHTREELSSFPEVIDQLEFRLDKAREVLRKNHVNLRALDAVVGRGGPVAPVISGTYLVDSAILEAVTEGRVMVEHPSLLGAPMARELALDSNCPSFVVDPVSVDELADESRLTGVPSIQRRALSHALSVKAAGREAAKRLGRPFEELDLVILHLGSGITVAVSKQGRQVDATDASSSGPMAPTRTGSLPALDLDKMCFSGRYTFGQMKKLHVAVGGWIAHLGTDDIREIYGRIDRGDRLAMTVMKATLLQIAKETAAMAAVLDGRIDGVVITGGIARSDRFISVLTKRLSWLSPTIIVLPGENEMLALAQGALRAVTGEAEAMSMGPYIDKFSRKAR